MKKIFFPLLLISAMLSHAQQDSLRNDTLQAIEISAPYKALKHTPLTFQDISQTRIEQLHVGQEPAFILGQTPSMTFYSDAGSFSGYAYFRLRGIDQTRINMTLDGVPLNEPEDQGVYFSNFPDFLNSVSGIQIQRGAGLTQNGTASYAGSIQFESPDLTDSTHGEAGASYGSYHSWRTYGEYLHGKTNIPFYVRGSLLGSDGYKHHSGNHSQSLFFSAGHLAEKHSLKFTAFAGHQANELAWLAAHPDSISQDPKFNANSIENDEFLQTLAQLQHAWYLSDKSSLKTSIYHQFLDGNYDFDLYNFLELGPGPEIYNYDFLSHFYGIFSNISHTRGNFELASGFHVQGYQRIHTGSEKTLGFLYRNTGYRNSGSVFGRMLYHGRKIHLLAEAQGRYSSFEYAGSVEMERMDWLFLNPRAGITWSFDQAKEVYLSAGYTGREPTRNDMFMGMDDLPADSLGNPLLGITDPEYVTDLEAGFRFRKMRMEFKMNFFHMIFENEIVLNGQFGPNGLALHSHVAASTRSGIEQEAEYRFPAGLAFIHHSSFSRNLISEENVTFEPVLSPEVIVNQEIAFDRNKWFCALSARYQSNSWLDFANTLELPAYFLLNARAGFRLKRLEFTLRVNNLTNSLIYSGGYAGWDGSPRYFVFAKTNGNLSVKWSF